MYNSFYNKKYDFREITYAKSFPNLHKYPATMIPQIGTEILKELNISKCKLLDPYCGSGSSFISALESNIFDFEGYDYNPLAILICKVKFTKINIDKLIDEYNDIKYKVYNSEYVNSIKNELKDYIPVFKNIDYWYSENIKIKLALLKYIISRIKNTNIKNFILLSFLDTVRVFSYTRNNEFKLYRIKKEDILYFNEDVYTYFFNKLNDNILFYKNYYYKYLINEKIRAYFYNESFYNKNKKFDVVLTSPPYGDSKTTVAYGQFSFFANMWLGNTEARKIDNILMGGKNKKQILNDSIISEQIYNIEKIDIKRALEVSSFYLDLRDSIKSVSNGISDGGYAIYIVGNRIVKNQYLNTDKFIAESFERENFKHLFTYKRVISNKRMPLKNSPTNKKGLLSNTMTEEFIVVLKKI